MFRCDAWWCLVPTSGSVCLFWIFCGMVAISTDTAHFVILRPPEDMNDRSKMTILWSNAMKPWTIIGHCRQKPPTLQKTNISHLGKRNVFKHALGKGYVSSQEGNCSQHPFKHPFHTYVLFWGGPSGRGVDLKSGQVSQDSRPHGSKQSIIT